MTAVLILLIPGVALLGLWAYALVDLLNTKFDSETDKLIWIVLVIFASFVGALLWLLWGRQNKKII